MYRINRLGNTEREDGWYVFTDLKMRDETTMIVSEGTIAKQFSALLLTTRSKK